MHQTRTPLVIPRDLSPLFPDIEARHDASDRSLLERLAPEPVEWPVGF